MILDELTALYNPSGVPLVSPRQVERALARLWQPASDSPDKQHATRVSLGNLMVVGRVQDWSRLARALGELSAVYPTRTIVVLFDDSLESQVLVSVSAICHVPEPNRPQVCCEQILLRLSPSDAGELPATVLPLFEADVPVFLWWTLSPSVCPGALAGLRPLAHRTIFDVGREGLETLSGDRERELGWSRTERWRAVVAGLFDECRSHSVEQISNLTLHVRGGSEDDLMDAVWLAAFVAGQCGWQPMRPSAPGRWEFEYKGSTQTVALEVSTGSPAGFAGLKIEAGESTFAIESCPGSPGTYRIHVADAAVCRLPRSIQVRRTGRAEAVGRAMKAGRGDRVFARALPIARFLARSLPDR